MAGPGRGALSFARGAELCAPPGGKLAAMPKGKGGASGGGSGASFAAAFDSSRGNAVDADYSEFSAVDAVYVLGDFGNGAGRMVKHDDEEPDQSMIMELVSSRERGRLLLDADKLEEDFDSGRGDDEMSLVKLFNLLADRCDMPRHVIKLVVRAKRTTGAGSTPDYVRILNKNMNRPVEFPSPFHKIGGNHDARIRRAVDEEITADMSESDKEILRERKRAEADGQAMDAGQLTKGQTCSDILESIRDAVRDQGARDMVKDFKGLVFSITDGSCEAPVLAAASRAPTSLRLTLRRPKIAGKSKLAAATMHIRRAEPLPGENEGGEWTTLVDWMDQNEWMYMTAYSFTVNVNGKAQKGSNFFLETDTLYQIKSTFVYKVPGVGLQESDATSITVRTELARRAQAQEGGAAAAAAATAAPAAPVARGGSGARLTRKRKREPAGREAAADKRSTPAGAASGAAAGAAAVADPRAPLRRQHDRDAPSDSADLRGHPADATVTMISSAEVDLEALEKAQLLFALQQVRTRATVVADDDGPFRC